ncbi:DNA-binding transcriptional repressor CitR [Atlantibacter sp.]|uniref:DNA-binding transcriptional repressor CitR n=1 Tax=Atlantibacter sp. TaxID=1903473 RepID=UPI0028B0F1B0|nr:LysR family transcriptional regulator [Atlantibacter sp.]
MMANLQDLKKFDLNLLVIFECVYLHRSVSKAAEALFLTPSAISQSIQRLRNQLNDPLFLREGKGITPTTVADNLHIYLEDNLQQLEQTIRVVQGAPQRKNFIIYCSTFMGFEFLSPLAENFCRQLGYELIHYDMAVAPNSAEDLLTYRKADLIIGNTPVINHSVICTPFMNVKPVLVCSKDHPRIGDSAKLDELQKEKFARVTGIEEGLRQYQVKSSEVFPEREVVFQSDSPITVMSAVGQSELLGIIGERGYARFNEVFNLKRVDTQMALPTLEFYLMYNRFALQSSAFKLLLENINQRLATLV